MSIIQKIIKFFSSKDFFEKAGEESKKWRFTCGCGNEFSIWDAGGIRYKAKGNPVKTARCPKCLKIAPRQLFKK